MLPIEAARRHYADRPLAKLTPEEVQALIDLGGLLHLLRDDLKNPLYDLIELAHREDVTREMGVT